MKQKPKSKARFASRILSMSMAMAMVITSVNMPQFGQTVYAAGEEEAGTEVHSHQWVYSAANEVLQAYHCHINRY